MTIDEKETGRAGVFEYFPHTADKKFRAYGKTLEEQFGNAALALYNVLTDTEAVAPKHNKSITVHGVDLKALLYSFLEELLFLIDAEGFLLSKVSAMKIHHVNGRYTLSALLIGDHAQAYETHGDIKAVTYAEMEIADSYVQVVLDI